MSDVVYPPTDAQLEYLQALQRRLRMSDELLAAYCVDRFGRSLAELARFDVSRLIEAMSSWSALPAEVRILSGQRPLL